MLQEADVVYAHHHRHGATQWSGVLHVQQVGAILATLRASSKPSRTNGLAETWTGDIARYRRGGLAEET